ncbi:MAG: hypothetical protein HUJ25_04305 [Crocinitomicaceae bacterium]|nr:hypothetical protein [Crocinitomicaceae bacterium]
MNLVKLSKIQMYFWFAMSAVTLVMVIVLFSKDMVEGVYFFIPVVCFLLGFLRRWQFKKLTKSAAERDAREKGKKRK